MAIEGKTKRISLLKAAVFESKDDLTAGDGAKHDVLPGKGALANRTTCNVFKLLKHCGGIGFNTAFLAPFGETKFLGLLCSMIPIEVVVRRAAHGSYLKRNPDVQKGTRFPKLIVEMYLKTKGRKFKQYGGFLCDDPLMRIPSGSEVALLYRPDRPLEEQEPFASVPLTVIFDSWNNERKLLSTIAEMAVWAFLILEVAWKKLGRTLADFKVEFGIYGETWLAVPVLADVIDNDSWRLISPEGEYEDKQGYRDGDVLERVLANYQRVAELTDQFAKITDEVARNQSFEARFFLRAAILRKSKCT